MRARLLCALALAALAAACGDDDDSGDDIAAADAGPADAAIAPCGIEAPGSRCASATVLERCNGAQIETVDCAGGDVCGPDPAAAGGAACIAPGGACGVIDYYGACEGEVLAWCDQGSLVVTDCGAAQSICDFIDQSVGFNCTTECAQQDVSAEGSCVPGGIRRCEFDEQNGYHVVTHACPSGSSCATVQETGWPGCIPDQWCQNVGPAGRCDGAVLTRCDGGSVQTSDCSQSGAVCTWGGDEAGYVCADAGAAGAYAVQGVVRYHDRPPMPGGLGPQTTALARGVTIAVVLDADGSVLAAGVTADDGSFSLSYDAPAGASVHLLAATTSASAERPVRVIRPDGLAHGFGGASFTPSADGTQDLLVTEASGVAAAFNVFDHLVYAIDHVRNVLGDPTPEPLFAAWIKGSGDGTYYIDNLNGMFLLGEPADDDGYDDTVILHESGHWIEDVSGRSDSPGGAHNGSPTDPNLAWSEGFATYFAMAVREVPIYMDSNAGGGWAFYGDTSVTMANANGPLSQDVSEDMVTEILWDSGDSGGSDDDGVAGTHDAVLQVQPSYLRVGPLRGVGEAGVDLVDWLDGFFVAAGLDDCAAMRAIVTQMRKFPYDFAGPGGACPP